MSLRITDVKITDNPAQVNQSIKIEVTVVEINWFALTLENLNWQSIKDRFSSWLDVKNL